MTTQRQLSRRTSSNRKRLKTVALGTAAALIFAPAVFAADSQCLLGDNGKIAVTTFEHRDGGSHRATEVTLIYGMHLLRGRLRDTDSGPIALSETGPEHYAFVGSLRVDYNAMKMTLKGKLKYTPTLSENYNTTFRCKTLQP